MPKQSHGVYRDKNGNPVPDGHGGFLPKHCECGGLLDYDYDFGRFWSACLSCTPVVHIKLSRMGTLVSEKWSGTPDGVLSGVVASETC